MSSTSLHQGALDRQDPTKRVMGGGWRDEAKSRATRLRTQARGVEAAAGPAAKLRLEVEVYKPLTRAEMLAIDRESFREWLSGSQVEDCWRLLRQAEEGLVNVAAASQVPTQAASALMHGVAQLGNDHPLVKSLQVEMERTSGLDIDALRGAAVAVLGAAHEHSDGRHRSVRQFRNRLLTLTVLLFVLAGVALCVQSLVDGALIAAPRGSADDPTGILTPTATLAVVLFFGAVGALFSALPSLAQLPENPQPFDLSKQQAALKVATGAWSAVIGMLAVGAGMTSASTDGSLGGMVLVAALFGAGQEAVTRFADHKAGELLRNTSPS